MRKLFFILLGLLRLGHRVRASRGRGRGRGRQKNFMRHGGKRLLGNVFGGKR